METIYNKKNLTKDPVMHRDSAVLLDRNSTVVKYNTTVNDSIKSFIGRIKSGDLGSLPIIIGLVIIFIVFGVLNPTFLSANNLVNLLFDSATAGVIALGIVCVLMLGEIDLSVGSISGVSSAILGVLWVNSGVPLAATIVIAIVLGGMIGAMYALLHNKFGMPSFVSTLAGLLSFLGVQLYLLGSTGSINLPYGSSIVNFGQLMTMPDWASYILAITPGIVMFINNTRIILRRRAVKLSTESIEFILFKAIAITIFLELTAVYLNQDRGIPWMFVLFICLVIGMQYAFIRTKWGRYMHAVGGNREAARRAGINVPMIYTSAFIACGVFAAIGGILAAARLASSSQQAGTGDVNLNAIAAAVIGGTSLFGGRGSAYSALLGVIIITSIASGLTMLNLSSSLRYIITGAVLAIAVIIDSLTRQSRVSHGRS